MEPLIEEKFKGAKGTVEGAAAAAVESTLHEEPYKQEEIEGTIGTSLSSLFEGNESQLKSVAFANKHGKGMQSLYFHPSNIQLPAEINGVMHFSPLLIWKDLWSVSSFIPVL